MSSSLKTSAIHFEDLEFIDSRSNNLSLSPEGGDSRVVVRGMACSGSPLLHAILEVSPRGDDSVSSEGESFGSPLPRACNTVMYAVPIATMSPPEETQMLQTVPTRP
jgi:hypothetical protein